MATKNLPAQDVLNQLLSYDPETGKLFWKERTVDMFKDSAWGREYSCRAWNARYARKEAFTAQNSNGYLHGGINGKSMQAHRVIFAMCTGEEPNEVDHINGKRDDNRLSNLRAVTAAQNRRNARRQTRNTSGATGVYRHKPNGKWHARITVNYVYIDLGYFDDFEAAKRARKDAEVRYGYHENHGRK